MDTLFGKAPAANFSTQSTLNPYQGEIFGVLNRLFGGGGPDGSAVLLDQAGGNQLAGTSLASLEQQAMGVPTAPTGQQTATQNQSFDVLSKALGYQAPAVTSTPAVSPQAGGVSQVRAGTATAPHIDATQAFTQGVVQPLTDDFLTKTLPGIAGKFGASAGGAFSSGGRDARLSAATDLERVLAQQGSQFALSAAGANQNADITTALANQSTDLTAGRANQTTDLSRVLSNQSTDLATILANQQGNLAASGANQSGSINAQKNILAALGIAPTVSTLPATTAGANIGLSSATFAPYQQLIADMIASSTPQTVQTLGVGSGGSTGILGGLLGGAGQFAGSAGGSALIASLFSDRRLKEDVEEVGSVDGFPLYKFRYKGTPERRLGLMAQDVEKRLPHAVGEVAGFKTVNYAAVLEDVLKEAA